MLGPTNESDATAPAGDSREQREAGAVMVAALAKRLGIALAPRRISLPDGGRLEIDATSDDLSVLCEAWAHQGPPKSAQRHKVLTDAFKLTFAARIVGGSPRLILLFSDKAATTPFVGKGWAPEALRTNGIEIAVVALPQELSDRVRAAQARQFR